MKRDYKNSTEEDVSYFIGTEIEKTDFNGERTLFVVGIQDADDIILKAVENKCTHIYLGANKSFEHVFPYDIQEIIRVLIFQTDLNVTLDISSDLWRFDYIRDDLKRYASSCRFAINLSVPVPDVDSFCNMNIKIDDTGFNQYNDGVYIYRPKIEDKTYWEEYSKDIVIK
jgi:hypothetical protein